MTGMCSEACKRRYIGVSDLQSRVSSRWDRNTSDVRSTEATCFSTDSGRADPGGEKRVYIVAPHCVDLRLRKE
jgi:hypothetical protein